MILALAHLTGCTVQVHHTSHLCAPRGSVAGRLDEPTPDARVLRLWTDSLCGAYPIPVPLRAIRSLELLGPPR